MNVNLFCGIDIGGTRVKLVVCDGNGVALVREQRSTSSFPDQPEEMVKNISRWAMESWRSAGASKASLFGVGVGFCGLVDHGQGQVISSVILPRWKAVNLGTLLSQAFAAPAQVDNDANLALLGEAAFGAGIGATNLVGFTIGTGIGGGAIVDGRLLRGSHSFGAELGHMTVTPGGLPCLCGNRGCLTVEASTAATLVRYHELSSQSGVSLEQIMNRAQHNDANALKAIEPMVKALGVGIANSICVFDPDTVLLVGGPVSSGPWFEDWIRNEVRVRVFPELFSKCVIRVAELGAYSGAMGGIQLIRSSFR